MKEACSWQLSSQPFIPVINMKKAFSLIEIIVAIGLLAIIAVTTSTLLLTSLRSARKSAAINEAKAEGQYALTDMVQNLKFAASIACNSATSLTMVDANTISTTYSLSGTRILKSISSPVTNLYITTSSAAVGVGACTGGNMFTCDTTNTPPRYLDICYWIDAAGASDVTNSAGTGTSGVNFATHVDLRNTSF